jgi:DNA-directed RNA polymerase specialized sigma subunit
MAVIRPIAEAAAALERELRRPPAVEEIAARARVHPCLVELALDAVGSA